MICDLGLSTLDGHSEFNKLAPPRDTIGTLQWFSPEVLEGKSRKSRGSDVYSWAWVAWEVGCSKTIVSATLLRGCMQIITGEMPYKGFPWFKIILTILESPHPQVDGESRLKECLPLWDLITRCWAREPEDRPTSSTCLTAVTSFVSGPSPQDLSRGHPVTCLALLRQPRCTLKADGVDADLHSAELLESLGDLKVWNGAYDEGSTLLENALQLHRSANRAKGIASVQCKKAALLYHTHQFEGSLTLSISSLEGFRDLDYEVGVANASFWLASGLFRQDKHAEAMSSLNESLAIFRRQKDDVGIIRCLERTAEIHRKQPHYEKALAMLQEAMRLAIRRGDRIGEANAMLILGATHLDKGDLDNAVKHCSSGLEIARRIGWKAAVITGLSQLGDIETQRGEYEVAEGLYSESLNVAETCGAHLDLAPTLSRLISSLREREGNTRETEVEEERRNGQYPVPFPAADAAWAASDLARLQRRQGRTERALFWYKRAITKHRMLGNRASLSKYLHETGMILGEMEQKDEAALHFEASLAIERELGRSLEASSSQKELGVMPMASMKWERPWWMDLECVGSEPRPESQPTLCDVRSVLLRVPQLITPNLKSRIRP